MRVSDLTLWQKCYKVKSVNETTTDYWLTLTGEKSVRAIAKTTGLDQSTLNRQLTGISDLRVQTVVAICRTYGVEMAPVFVKAGFLTEEEAREFSAAKQLKAYSDIELSTEMLRRVTEGSATKDIEEPADPELVEKVIREAEAAKSTGVSGSREDLSKLDEQELGARYDLAAGTDESADRIDPETQ
jgi:transcriptional regulator with XRE-family HTH domain